MKPNIKQIFQLCRELEAAGAAKGMNYAEISRLANVDQAQVSRIMRGEFKTFSNNVVQVCRVLGVSVPEIFPQPLATDRWNKAFASVQRILDQSQDGGKSATRLLEALADLQAASVGPKPND